MSHGPFGLGVAAPRPAPACLDASNVAPITESASATISTTWILVLMERILQPSGIACASGARYTVPSFTQDFAFTARSRCDALDLESTHACCPCAHCRAADRSCRHGIHAEPEESRHLLH